MNSGPLGHPARHRIGPQPNRPHAPVPIRPRLIAPCSTRWYDTCLRTCTCLRTHTSRRNVQTTLSQTSGFQPLGLVGDEEDLDQLHLDAYHFWSVSSSQGISHPNGSQQLYLGFLQTCLRLSSLAMHVALYSLRLTSLAILIVSSASD